MTGALRPTVSLEDTICPICDTLGNAEEVYPANFDFEDFNTEIFSARRLPDQIHYRIVRCNRCGLLRSDPVISDGEFLNQLYSASHFTYSTEIDNLKQTYGKYLKRVPLPATPDKVLIEIGGGNGFFLTQALEQGYNQVYNIEPSEDAIRQAPSGLEKSMICDVFREGLFDANTVDTICFFQVFDHLPQPLETLQICYNILKPGGTILFLNHNAKAFSAKILGKRSPIIDIEHTYLYDPQTLSQFVEKMGFSVIESGAVKNQYSLGYVLRLLYLPKPIKKAFINLVEKTPLKHIKGSFPLGNMYLIAQKPLKTGN